MIARICAAAAHQVGCVFPLSAAQLSSARMDGLADTQRKRATMSTPSKKDKQPSTPWHMSASEPASSSSSITNQALFR